MKGLNELAKLVALHGVTTKAWAARDLRRLKSACKKFTPEEVAAALAVATRKGTKDAGRSLAALFRNIQGATLLEALSGNCQPEDLESAGAVVALAILQTYRVEYSQVLDAIKEKRESC